MAGIQNLNELIESTKSWGFSEQEIREQYDKFFKNRVDEYGFNPNDPETAKRALMATFMHYKAKQMGIGGRETKRVYVVAISSPSEINRKKVADIIAMKPEEREKMFGEGTKANYRFDGTGFPMTQSKFGAKAWAKLPIYRRVLVMALMMDKTVNKMMPYVLEVRDNFDWNKQDYSTQNTLNVAKQEPFAYFNAEVGTFKREDSGNNKILSCFALNNREPVTISDSWSFFNQMPAKYQTKVNDYVRAVERASNISGFDLTGSFVMSDVIISSIGRTNSGGYQATIMDTDVLTGSQVVTQVFLPESSRISERFGNESEVAVFGTLIKSSTPNDPPRLIGWSTIQSANPKAVTPPVPKISASDNISKSADEVIQAAQRAAKAQTMSGDEAFV